MGRVTARFANIPSRTVFASILRVGVVAGSNYQNPKHIITTAMTTTTGMLYDNMGIRRRLAAWRTFGVHSPISRSFRFLRRESVVPPGGREEAIQLLREFSSNADELLIADPYLMNAGHPKRPDYPSLCRRHLSALSDAMDLSTNNPKVIRTISDSKLDQPKLRQMFSVRIREHNRVEWEHHDTRATIHDRVWVKRVDTKRTGLFVGTSLNSIGFKFSFIVTLPESDLAEFLSFASQQCGTELGAKA